MSFNSNVAKGINRKMLKVDCGGDRFSDVTHLSDAVLASRLRELGADIGPVNNATRKVYQRKLQRMLQNRISYIHQEEPLVARPVATSHVTFESNLHYASLQQHESHRQAGGRTRNLSDDAENITCKELASAESLEQSARNASPSRSSNSLRNRTNRETGEEDRLHECDRTRTDFAGGLSFAGLRISVGAPGPGLVQPGGGGRCLPHQVQEQRPTKQPTFLAVLLFLILICLLAVLIFFNMEPEYQNPALQ